MKAPSNRASAQRTLRRARAAARRFVAVLVAAVLCVSLGFPSVVVTDAGFPLGASHQAAFAAEGDGGATEGGDPEQPVDPPVDPPAPAKVQVPWVVDLTVDAAKYALGSAGLAFEVQGDTSGSAIVVSQSHSGMVSQDTVIVIEGKLEIPKPVLTQVTVGYRDPDTKTPIPRPDPSVGQSPIIKTKGGQIELLASVLWDSNTGGYAGDQGVPVAWTSDDPSLATVDPSSGIVTGMGDGTVRIRCTTIGYGDISSYIDIRIVGQDGAYVEEVAVVKETGESYGEERLLFSEYDGSTGRDLYAEVLYSDGTRKNTAKGDTVEGLTWSTTDEKTASIGIYSGRLKPLSDGTVEAVATVSGGMDGPVSGSITVVMDSGQLGPRNPVSSITFEITYEKDSDQVYDTKTYDVGSLSALGSVQQAYTQFTSNGNYQTLCAEGVPINTVMADLGVEPSEVLSLYLSTADTSNPWVLPGSYVFGRASYYLPDYASIGSMAGAIPASPMIAYRTSESKSGTADFSSLNGNDCFRLCLGTSGDKADGSAQRSRYNISKIKVVLAGSPPLDPDPGPENTPPGGGGGGKGSGTGSGLGSEGTGTGAGGTSGTSGDKTVLGLSNTSELSSDGSQGAEGGSAGGEGDGRRWQVFEMMSKAKSDVDPLDYSNPLEPFLLPGVLAVMAAGGVTNRVRFRRELAV